MKTAENLTRATSGACGPCTGDCQQGRACPCREERPIPGAGIVLAVATSLVALAALVVVL